jgi:hypothetical protein
VRYRSSAVVAFGVVVVLLGPAPAAAINRDGLFRGATSQDRAIRFVVDGGDISNVRFSIFHRPCNLTVTATSGPVAFPIADDGAFVMRFFSGDGDTAVVARGEFTSRDRARGTFRSVQESRGCGDVARGSWRAHRAPA